MNQQNPRPPIPPRWQRQANGFDMWRVWTNHYERVLGIVNPNKLQQYRMKRTIKARWNAIARLHPQDHARLKRFLCDAIDRASVSERDSNNALAAAQASLGNPQSTRRQRTDSYKRALRMNIKSLLDLTALVKIETRIGTPADAVRAFDATRTDVARRRVDDAANRVAEQQRDELRPLDVFTRRRVLNAHRAISSRALTDQVPRSTFVPIFGGNNDTNLGLWIRGDANGNIVERSVVKDICFHHDPFEWDNPVNWENVLDPLDKVLTEAHIMKRLRDTGSNNVVTLRWSQLRASELIYRMYLEYCPYGDLGNLLAHYQNINQPIPEPLIWHVFESLVSVGLLMEQGHITQAQNPWAQIFHRDFKPQNVFLGNHPRAVPNRDNWAAYPTIKLGDYGLAVETSPPDNRNPRAFTDAGTPRYQAPEQIDDPDNPSPTPLTAQTNVFGVGITVMALMDRHGGVGVWDNWAAARAGSRNPADYPHLDAQAAANYSERLVSLVSGCVEYGPNDRTSFFTLRAAILYHTQGQGGLPQNDLAQGMRASTVQQLGQIGLGPDLYALRSAMGQVVIPAPPPLVPLHFESDDDDDDDDDDDEEDE